MLDRRQLGGQAALEALRLRSRLGAGRTHSVSPIDAAEQLGIEVRLIDLPSMEGVYVAGEDPKIVLSTCRPPGRRHFTCAHEIGHHVFKHGAQFDELSKARNARRSVDPKEFLADCFASYFLMPKSAIEAGAMCRGFAINSMLPEQAFSLASWLGVGYTTLISHLQYGLKAIDEARASALRAREVADIKATMAGFPVPQSLHVVDRWWEGRALDCEVGDHIVMPPSTMCEGACLDSGVPLIVGSAVRASRPGLARLSGITPFWSVFVRVSPYRFSGRACFRFDEGVEE